MQCCLLSLPYVLEETIQCCLELPRSAHVQLETGLSFELDSRLGYAIQLSHDIATPNVNFHEYLQPVTSASALIRMR